MAKARATARRTVITPTVTDLAIGGGAVASETKTSFWKQILPETSINYVDDRTNESRTIDFDREYLTDLASAFDEKALDQTAFLLADKDNAHTMDPERYRADVDAMVLDEDLPESVKAELTARHGEVPRGLYSKLSFATKKAAKAVRNNPNLGVSARIREGISRSDGRTFKRAVIHVLGTLDPKIPGMSGWTPAVDLSEYASDDVLDLSSTTYPEASVPKSKAKAAPATGDAIVVPSIDDVDPADIADWDDATLAAFLEANSELIAALPDGLDASDEGDEDDDDSDDSDEDDTDPAQGRQLQEASLSNKAQRDIDLANSRATAAERTAREALRRQADAEWARERDSLLGAGVPPHVLDLAEPLLRGADDLVIDLSNSGGERDVNASAIVRQLVDGYQGVLDLSARERGHSGIEGGADPDAGLKSAFAEFTADL